MLFQKSVETGSGEAGDSAGGFNVTLSDMNEFLKIVVFGLIHDVTKIGQIILAFGIAWFLGVHGSACRMDTNLSGQMNGKEGLLILGRTQ